MKAFPKLVKQDGGCRNYYKAAPAGVGPREVVSATSLEIHCPPSKLLKYECLLLTSEDIRGITNKLLRLFTSCL
uniref:Uncharacterized protein n=1 Tax=Ascaris lumbricoides TaxID=6252 RepID=A0A0M3IUR9_ASCLU